MTAKGWVCAPNRGNIVDVDGASVGGGRGVRELEEMEASKRKQSACKMLQSN